jgi:ribonuclease HII
MSNHPSSSNRLELQYWNQDIDTIIGIDEVGRGCFAGPMVIAAYSFDRTHYLSNKDLYSEIRDSKRLSEKKRDSIFINICNGYNKYSLTWISPKEIDAFGISQCTQWGFANAVKKLLTNYKTNNYKLLVDGFKIKDYPDNEQLVLTKGEDKSISIGAASILAKVTRDNMMKQLSKIHKYQKYGFYNNKGYGTKQHREALVKNGAEDIHRKTFIKKYI